MFLGLCLNLFRKEKAFNNWLNSIILEISSLQRNGLMIDEYERLEA